MNTVDTESRLFKPTSQQTSDNERGLAALLVTLMAVVALWTYILTHPTMTAALQFLKPAASKVLLPLPEPGAAPSLPWWTPPL